LARTGRPIAQLREFEAVRFASGKKTKHRYILYSQVRAAHPNSFKQWAFFKRCAPLSRIVRASCIFDRLGVVRQLAAASPALRNKIRG